ncbi:thioredoxin domain-containing protein (plasmid) [Pseudomonas corrugata]|uniref:DsbA family protein n=1 Tax=Pseudomonas corrugata TaxID=47879 RepID=UPI003D819DAB
MPKIKTHLAIAIGVSIVTSAVAVGGSVLMSQRYIDKEVKDALVEQLPGALDKTLMDREIEKINKAKAKILSKWTGAAETAPQGRHIYGSMEAEFTLVEFSDLECPYCKRFHDTPKQMADKSEGRINWEWQHYPLAFHNPVAEVAAHASECVGEVAGNKAFWAFTGEWFARTQLNGQGIEDVERLAQEVGAPIDAYRQCMESGKYQVLIESQVKKGTNMGVTGTPATVVVDNLTGNKLLVKGAQSTQVLLQTMQELVKMRDQASNQDKLTSSAEGATNENSDQ